jgi:putative modified peptide
MDPKVVRKLLDLLSSDNDFRRLFKKDARAALAKAGYKAPAGAAAATATDCGDCMQLQASDRIAPKANIQRDRAKLEATLALPMRFVPPPELQAD